MWNICKKFLNMLYKGLKIAEHKFWQLFIFGDSDKIFQTIESKFSKKFCYNKVTRNHS